MRSALIIDFMLGFALQFFKGQEDDSGVEYVQKVIALKSAGSNVDDHMLAVRDVLLGDKPVDFVDLTLRIDSEVDELLGRGDLSPDNEPDVTENAGPDDVGGEDTAPPDDSPDATPANDEVLTEDST